MDALKELAREELVAYITDQRFPSRWGKKERLGFATRVLVNRGLTLDELSSVVSEHGGGMNFSVYDQALKVLRNREGKKK